MSDERYDRSADMRLLEHRRQALGVPSRVMRLTSYSDHDPLSDVSKSDEEAYVQSGTILIATLDAQPRNFLIPGALVTISLSVANDGDVPAHGVTVNLPLPGDTTYRAGTLFVDGTAGSDATANELLESGAEIGDVPPGARRTLVVKLMVEAGLSDIMLSPHLSAASGAVLGLRAMRLTRAAPSRQGLAVERPFYESDDAETTFEPLAPSAAQPTITALPRESTLSTEGAPVAQMPLPTVTEPVNSNVAEPVTRTVTEPVASDVAEPAASDITAAVASNVAAAVASTVTEAVASDVTEPVASDAAEPVAPAVTESINSNLAESVTPSTLGPVATRVPKAVTKRTTESKAKPKQRVKSKQKAKAEVVKESPAANVDASVHEPVAEPVGRPKLEVVRSVDDRVSFAGQGGPILAVRIQRKRLTTLTGLFSGESLGMIAHYLVLNALAVRDPLPGDGTDGSIAAFVASQEQLLSRALIATRLGKTPAADSVGAELPLFPPALATHADRRAIETPPLGEAMLLRAFQPSDVLFVQRMLANDEAAPFMRAAQLFVGLCANDAVVAEERERHRLGVALTAYAALATAEISRIFLRAKLSRAPALFKATDSAFDDAARTVLAALGRSIV